MIQRAVSASTDGHVRSATTDADGRFEVRGLVPGTRYSIDVNGGGALPGERVVSVAGARDVRIVATRGLTIGGVLEDENGKPLPACRILLEPHEAGSDPKWGLTDEHGRFAIEGLAPGTWHIGAWSSVRGVEDMRPCGSARAGDTDVTLRVGKR